MLEGLGPEFTILREVPLEDIQHAAGPLVAEGIRRLRSGQVARKPGYDGAYGVIQLLSPAEREVFRGQVSLFGAEAPRQVKSAKGQVSKSARGSRAKSAAPAGELNGEQKAAVTATGTIGGVKCVVGVLDSRFLMGSMSAAVGEKITLAIEFATKNKLPLILFAASGGARMQEGILSLMQMAKTSAVLERFSQRGGLYISVFTHPTTGGVTASFASLGDIILAEPGALIGFAGPRVIQQTIGQTLPEGFQRAEFQMAHGFVDAVVPRVRMRETLSQLLRLHEKGGRQ